MRKTAVQFGLAVLVLGGSVAAQTPAPAARDGVITGQVVDAGTGRPVSAVIVSISVAGLVSRTTFPGGFTVDSTVPRILTGSDGRFAFRNLPAGTFTVTATKGGYADGASGRRVIAGPSQPVALTAAQPTAEVPVRMWKNAVIAGTIIDEAGEPVVGLQVRAARRTFTGGRRRFVPGGASATTDDRGAYRISGLLPGEYLIATSPPMLSANLSLFADISRSGGGGVGEMAALLPPGGVANGIQVGGTQLMVGRGGAIPPPPVAGRVQIYPPTFYPAAAAPAQATTIIVASGEERAGVDLQLAPVPTVRVSGTVMSSSGPAGMVTLRLVPAGVEEMAADALAPVSFADGTGTFTFAAVPPGQYTLRASAPILAAGPTRAADLYWLAMPMAIAGDDVNGVVAAMQPSLRITARLGFEGATPRPPEQSRATFVGPPFMLESADDSPPAMMGGQTGASAEGGVTLGGYAAGKYRVRVTNSPAGWMFKAAMLNGVDVSETPFDFTRDITDLVLMFTDRWSGMSGTVRGSGAAGAMVIAFTTNAQSWDDQGPSPRRLKIARTNAGGEFGLSSVPPGDYYVIAVPEEQAGDWRDPKVLEVLARQATQVSIAEGEHKTIDLRLKEVRQ